MARIDVPYLIAKPGAKGGTRYFWQPSSALRGLGWRSERLPDDVGQAIERAKELNRQLESWRKGETPAPAVGQGAPGPIVRPGTVADLIRRYKASRFYPDNETTRESYDRHLRTIEDWAGQDLVTDIDAGDIQDLYESFRAATPAKAAAVIRVARLLFQCAVRFDMRKDNPAAKPGLEGAPFAGRLWPIEAVLLVVEAADKAGRHSIGTAVLINWWLGQRLKDIIALKRIQYRDGRIWITQSKTNARVSVPHSPLVARRIEQEMARLDARKVTSTHLIVHEGTSQPYNIHTFKHDFADIRAAAAKEWGTFFLDDGSTVDLVDLHFRHLRHTAITELAAAGCDAPLIATFSGHTIKSVEQILDRYLVRSSELAMVAANKRMERDRDRF
ncbi:MAG TPA: tyrosine-type recombinase/integrase [Candidatus Omnitrophota bacterium]|nr:tyrosine-type recombinase/integrase [Candidatus Omnitrophota bacterium]